LKTKDENEDDYSPLFRPIGNVFYLTISLVSILQAEILQ